MDRQVKVQLMVALLIHYGFRFFWKFLGFILTTIAINYLLQSCEWNPFVRLPNAPPW